MSILEVSGGIGQSTQGAKLTYFQEPLAGWQAAKGRLGGERVARGFNPRYNAAPPLLRGEVLEWPNRAAC